MVSVSVRLSPEELLVGRLTVPALSTARARTVPAALSVTWNGPASVSMANESPTLRTALLRPALDSGGARVRVMSGPVPSAAGMKTVASASAFSGLSEVAKHGTVGRVAAEQERDRCHLRDRLQPRPQG